MAASTRRSGPGLRALLAGGGLLGLAAEPAEAVPIDPSSSTVGWTPIAYPTLLPDYSDDQRTGIPEADIVGDTVNPAFYFRFDDAGTPSTTDGAIGFRVRIGADKNPAGFDHFMGVGLDANADGALDLFLAVENSGNPDQLGIFDAGSGANTSPSTTSINSSPLVSYALSVSNYDFDDVDATIDPTATTFDIDADGDTDQFLTWVIPFGDLVAALSGQGISGFDDGSAMRFVLGSSTQPNALNQDLGGPNGGTSSTSTWSTLGAFSNFGSAAGGFAPIPEPNTATLVSLGLHARGRCALAPAGPAEGRLLLALAGSSPFPRLAPGVPGRVGCCVDVERLLWVTLGSAIGGALRYVTSQLAHALLGSAYPYGTLVVNLVGSFGIGLIMHLGLSSTLVSPTLRLFLTTGVMGGFTTYSAFNYETLALLREGPWEIGLLNLAVMVAGCLAAGVAGLALGRALVGP